MKEAFNFPVDENFSEVIKEKNEPVKNLAESFEKLYYFQGKVTHASKFDRSQNDTEGRDRPLFLRQRRAELLKQIEHSWDREEKEKLLNKAKALDEIAAQYLDQQDVSVKLPEFGDEAISARLAVIKPPEEFVTEETKDAAPIFFVPGISNDIECVNNVISEVALQGREIVTVGYPEGFSGHITEDFIKALEKEPGVKAHSDFFKEVFAKVQKKYDKPMELWGLSMGAPIIAQILNDPKYQEKASDAVMLFPAQSVDMKSSAMNLGAVKEMNYLKNKTAALNWTVNTNRPPDERQLKLRKQALNINVKKMLKKDESWRTAAVRPGGKLIVALGDKDNITKSYQAVDDFKTGNANLELIEFPEAHHMTINVEPTEIIKEILSAGK